MALAIFDLDNTLLAGDSDHLWGEFLVEQGAVDAASYRDANERFYRDYQQGTLDIHAFLEFALRPLAEHPPERLAQWRKTFLAEKIDPIILSAGRTLIADHRERGDLPMIITATNSFITAPIAERLGVEVLLATTPEQATGGRYTGRVSGIPTFREGKIKALDAWLSNTAHDLQGSWFYSDSHNDIPLLERVSHPVAVDPDADLKAHADREGWRVISLRQATPA
ncbi:HAD family hydrolase [Alkalilimnicola sp. S0819]|uniref:histidinol-phosphatase n=1 Tax=Alkalilimnicola sp. S0819 TaxID=2613922 RepID=UPI001261DD65|nr:HAD family hydrolase [Alkalilimnicola sp. S0819]KAB7623034.1 HAD family hydrolase [Alkalilimnicola sp. S0819]MPQ17147.1 HAD-IB family hydrolase [Alkalilimnicola sp. S0819]